MTITRVRQPHHPGWETGRRRHPRPGQCPHPGLRHLHPKHAGRRRLKREWILRLRALHFAQDDRGERQLQRPSYFCCHSERGAPRSESEINMLAGGKHTAIQRSESKNLFPKRFQHNGIKQGRVNPCLVPAYASVLHLYIVLG